MLAFNFSNEFEKIDSFKVQIEATETATRGLLANVKRLYFDIILAINAFLLLSIYYILIIPIIFFSFRRIQKDLNAFYLELQTDVNSMTHEQSDKILEDIDGFISKFNDLILLLIGSKLTPKVIIKSSVNIRNSLFQINDLIIDCHFKDEQLSEEYLDAVKELFED